MGKEREEAGWQGGRWWRWEGRDARWGRDSGNESKPFEFRECIIRGLRSDNVMKAWLSASFLGIISGPKSTAHTPEVSAASGPTFSPLVSAFSSACSSSVLPS